MQIILKYYEKTQTLKFPDMINLNLMVDFELSKLIYL